MLSCEICEIFKNNFLHRRDPVAASEQTQESSEVHCMAKWYFGHLPQVLIVQYHAKLVN